MALSAFHCHRLTLLSKNLLRSSVVSQILTRHKSSHESKKWPGYYVMYNMESIRTINAVNRIKYRTTIVSGAVISLINALEITMKIDAAMVQTVSLAFGAVTVFLHLLGYFCNNVIGIIYSKKDSDEVKIAYVSYWGKRMDIDTTYDDVSCPEPKSALRDPLFNPMIIKSQNKKLRLYIDGKVIDGKRFDKLMGVDF